MSTATAIQRQERFELAGRPGFFLDGCGYEFFDPPADPEDVRRRLDALLGDVEPPAIVRAVAIDGRLPSVEQLAAVERELQKAPAKVLADFREHRGQVEVVPHGRVSDHPVAKLCRHTGRSFGFCVQGPKFTPLIVVEADEDAGTTLHELAHFVDRGNRFSGLPEWRPMAAAATAITRVGSSLEDSDGGFLAGLFNARRNPCEAFCEGFAVAYFSPRTRSHLSADMRQFIERVCE
jgi:hypothetical protein